MRRADRATAAVGAAAVVAGSVAASIAQRVSPRTALLSELGIHGRRLSGTFRLGEAAAAVACVRLGSSAVRAAKQSLVEDDDQRPEHAPPPPAVGRRPNGLTDAVARRTGGELRGLALTAAGGCLLVSAAVPSSPGCPIPLLDGRVPIRDWVHVPVLTAAFYLWPMAANGRLRPLLVANLLLLGPPALFAPHGPVMALLQRSMAAMAAAALATWSPTTDAARARNLVR